MRKFMRARASRRGAGWKPGGQKLPRDAGARRQGDAPTAVRALAVDPRVLIRREWLLAAQGFGRTDGVFSPPSFSAPVLNGVQTIIVKRARLAIAKLGIAQIVHNPSPSQARDAELRAPRERPRRARRAARHRLARGEPLRRGPAR